MRYCIILFLILSCTHADPNKETPPANTKIPKETFSLPTKRNPEQANPFPKQNMKPSGDIEYLDFRQIRTQISQHIDSIHSVCNKQEANQLLRWTQLKKGLDHLNEYLDKTLKTKRLEKVDQEWLQNISSNVKPEVLHYKGRDSHCENIRNTFFVNYSLYYNLQDGSTTNDFPDDWAKKISLSLNCACKK